MSRVHFLPFRNDLSALHIIDHVYGPLLSGYPAAQYIGWLVFFRDPELYDLVFNNLDLVERVLLKVARGEKLTSEEKKVVCASKKFFLGRNLRSFVEEAYEKFKEEWKKHEEKALELLDSAFSVAPSVKVFPSFEADGWCGGTVYGGEYIGISFGRGFSPKRCVRTFIHELVHVYHRKDKVLNDKLESLKKKHGVPVAEAFTETLTNVVAWKIGLQEEPFVRYYHRGWKELVEWEDRFGEVLKKNDFDLYSLKEHILGLE